MPSLNTLSAIIQRGAYKLFIKLNKEKNCTSIGLIFHQKLLKSGAKFFLINQQSKDPTRRPRCRT